MWHIGARSHRPVSDMFTSSPRWRGTVLLSLLFVLQAGSAEELSAPSAKPDFLLANIDKSVPPGDDFFQYANGGWIKRNPIPPSESDWGVGSLVREQINVTLRGLHARAAGSSAPAGSDDRRIGDFWRAALDIELARRLGSAPLRRELARIDAAKDKRQALDAAFALRPLVTVFFSFYVDQDEKESQVVSVHVDQGGLGLPERDFYVNEEKSIRQIRAAYVKHLARLLGLLGRGDAAATNTAAAAVMRFETELAGASRTLEDTRDPVANYNRLGSAEFTRDHTPSINWAERLGAWNLQPEYIVVGQPEYFTALDHILAQTPVAVIKDYLRLRLVTAYAEYLSPAFDAEYFDFHKRVLAGQKVQQPRWKRVLATEGGFVNVASPIGMMVGQRFVSEHFPESAKKRYAEMVRAIVDAYRARIATLDWMTEVTRARALEKLAAVYAKVGYPDRWPDTSSLIIGRGSYCENMMNIAQWRFNTMLARFGKPVDRTEWRMTPQTYNAYYNPSNNEIVLPAVSFFIPGVADADVDDATAYAYAGASTIGHEITHGFDDTGRKFDALGNLTDWWTAADAAEYDQRAAVLVRQFDAYEPLPGFHINGKASLGENIADLGGVMLALDAFKKTDQYRSGVKIAGFTPMQRFFLGYGLAWMMQVREEQTRRRLLSDFHAPPKWRVLGPLSNVADFYAAFGVTQNQKMWRAPEQRARVW